MNFIKMQTLGNDYAIIDCLSYKKNDLLKLKSKVKLLSDYHYGIGARGIIFITSSAKADVKMIMYNPDGTESKMCSDGLRCVAVYLNKKVKKVKFEIETKAGIIPVLIDKDVIINMGKINITPKKIEITINSKKRVLGDYNIHYVSDKYYHIGIIEIKNMLNNPIKIYNAERCICDILKSNDIDVDLQNEVLRKYFNSEEKDIDKLLEYSKIFNIYEKVNTLVEYAIG